MLSQRGTIELESATVTVELGTPVAVGKSFALATTRGASTTQSRSHYPRVMLTDVVDDEYTKVQFYRVVSTSCEIEWQVVEVPSFTVAQVTTQVDELSNTSSISTIDQDETFAIVTACNQSHVDDARDAHPKVDFTSDTQIRVTRYNTRYSMFAASFVISQEDAVCTRGSITLLSGIGREKDISLSNVDPANTMLAYSYIAERNTVVGYNFVLAHHYDASTLKVERSRSDGSADSVQWYLFRGPSNQLAANGITSIYSYTIGAWSNTTNTFHGGEIDKHFNMVPCTGNCGVNTGTSDTNHEGLATFHLMQGSSSSNAMYVYSTRRHSSSVPNLMSWAQLTTVLESAVAQATVDDATNIDTTSVTLSGTIGGRGDFSGVMCGFQVWEEGSDPPDLSTSPGTWTTSTGSTSTNISDLTPSTTYEFRLAKYNGACIMHSEVKEFTTLAAPPQVETKPATDIGADTAKLHGEITDMGGEASVDVFFEYREKGFIERFHDDFSAWSGWSDYGSGSVERSDDVAKVGTHSLKKIDNNDAHGGGWKSLDQNVGRDYDFTGWIYSPDPRAGGNADRLAISDSNFDGYGPRITGDVISIERRDEGSGTIISPEVEYDRPDNEWYEFKFKCNNNNTFTLTIYDLNGDEVDSVTSDADTNYAGPFDRVVVHGGYPFYVDDLRVKSTEDWESTFKQTKTEIGNFDDVVSDLEPETTYEFVAVAEYNGEYEYGSILEFATEASALFAPLVIEAGIQRTLTARLSPDIGILGRLRSYSINVGTGVLGESYDYPAVILGGIATQLDYPHVIAGGLLRSDGFAMNIHTGLIRLTDFLMDIDIGLITKEIWDYPIEIEVSVSGTERLYHTLIRGGITETTRSLLHLSIGYSREGEQSFIVRGGIVTIDASPLTMIGGLRQGYGYPFSIELCATGVVRLLPISVRIGTKQDWLFPLLVDIKDFWHHIDPTDTIWAKVDGESGLWIIKTGSSADWGND